MKFRRMLAVAVMLAVCGHALPSASAPVMLTDAELDEARGGVLLAGELAFQFGAIIRTYEQGSLALETQVTWTPDGARIDQLLGAGVTQLNRDELNALGGMQVFQTASGAALVHDVTEGHLVNVLMNTGSDTQFRQVTDITLVLPGFEAVQGEIGRNLLGMRMWDDLAIGSVGALGVSG